MKLVIQFRIKPSKQYMLPAFAIPLHTFILLPMPPNANLGLSMENLGIAWVTRKTSFLEVIPFRRHV